MPARALASSSNPPEETAARKIDPAIRAGFARRKAQDLIVELVLPALRFVPRDPIAGIDRSRRPGIWPTPPTSDDALTIDKTFRETTARLRDLGVSEVVELRSAGSLVVKASEGQLAQIAAWPSVRRVYANSAV